MAYQALYRQWRPTDFNDMVGQEAIVNTLRNQVAAGRIAHAYLFCGSRGTGKTSTAKIMSRAVNCEHADRGNPCGQCESCRRLAHDESLDVLEIDAASNNGVDEIRDLRETVKYPPQYGRFKVYIIDEVHMLSASAFNALLKTLEEPPAHVIFILATTEPQKLPATILSRCQRFDFGRIPAHQIAGRLRQAVEGAQATADDSALHLIARAAEGGMRDALSILDMCLGYQNEVTEALVRNVLGTSDRSFLFRFADALAEADAAQLMQLIDELMRGGREPIVFAKDVSQHLRALMIAKCCPNDMMSLLDLTQEDAYAYAEQADTFSQTRLMRIMELFMAVEADLRWSSSPRLALENAALKACLRTADVDAAELNERIAELEKQIETLSEKIKNGVVAAPARQQKAAAPAPEKAPAKPAAPQPKVLTPTGRSPEETWKEAMNQLKRTDAGCSALLSQGTFAGCTGTMYRWEAPMGMDFFVASLNMEAKRQAISAALTQAAGVECQFEARMAGTPDNVDEVQSENAFLDTLRESFGAEHVVIQQDVNE